MTSDGSLGPNQTLQIAQTLHRTVNKHGSHSLGLLDATAPMFARCMSPGAALIVKSGGTNISGNARDGVLNHKTDHITFFL